VGLFLTPQARAALLAHVPARYPELFASHVTVLREPSAAQLTPFLLASVGLSLWLRAEEEAFDDALGAQAVRVGPETGRAMVFSFGPARPQSRRRAPRLEINLRPAVVETRVADTFADAAPAAARPLEPRPVFARAVWHTEWCRRVIAGVLAGRPYGVPIDSRHLSPPEHAWATARPCDEGIDPDFEHHLDAADPISPRRRARSSGCIRKSTRKASKRTCGSNAPQHPQQQYLVSLPSLAAPSPEDHDLSYNAHPHVTISTRRGVPPVTSNAVLAHSHATRLPIASIVPGDARARTKQNQRVRVSSASEPSSAQTHLSFECRLGLCVTSQPRARGERIFIDSQERLAEFLCSIGVYLPGYQRPHTGRSDGSVFQWPSRQKHAHKKWGK
jgi:hypothetical protein